MYVYINYPLTISCTSGWGRFKTSCLGGVFLSSQKKEWLITPGFESKIPDSSFRYVPLEDTLFLRSATYTRNINWQAVVKTGTVGSDIKLKFVLTIILQNIQLFIKKSSYFLMQFANRIEKHNFTDSEDCYIKVIISVLFVYI